MTFSPALNLEYRAPTVPLVRAPHTNKHESANDTTDANQRVLVVSNRVAPTGKAASAGGLAVALLDAVKTTDGVWFGWSGEVKDEVSNTPVFSGDHGVSRAMMDLTSNDYDEYYNGFANRVLWPLFHHRIDLTAYNQRDYDGYLRVNARFARGLAPLVRPDDVLWVHDYHLVDFGRQLREQFCRNRMGFFLHIPFPPPGILTTLPVHDRLMRSLCEYDLIGFQTDADRRAFLEYLIYEADGKLLPNGQVRAYGRTLTVRVFPIGIDVEGFQAFAHTEEAQASADQLRAALAGRVNIIGVDRLDYSKGLPERFEAFQTLLRNHPETRGQAVFTQIAPVSRIDVPEYAEIREQLDRLSGSINAEFSELDSVPLRYVNRAMDRRQLAGLYRASRVGLVTPLRDGMNLVAKEYVAAQASQDPGVLVLSRFAGAAQTMPGALIVNPYDRGGVAKAIHDAINMPLEERQERWTSMMEATRHHDVHTWQRDFLSELRPNPVTPLHGELSA